MSTKCMFGSLCAFVLAGCAGGHIASKPGVYDVTVQPVRTARRDVHATYVRPVQARHPGYVMVFATGDDGWFGTSRTIFKHLADEGYEIAGFSSPEVLRPIGAAERVSTSRAAQGLKELFAQVKRDLGVPESTPIIIV